MKRKINMKVIYKEISNIFKYLFLENVKSHVPVTSKRLIQIKKSKLTFFFLNCVEMIFVLLLYDDCVPHKYASFWPIYWTKITNNIILNWYFRFFFQYKIEHLIKVKFTFVFVRGVIPSRKMSWSSVRNSTIFGRPSAYNSDYSILCLIIPVG